MRPGLAASILTALFACFGANEIACAQTSNFRIDEFQLPIQSSPPFTRPLGPPARRESESEYVGTWTTEVNPRIQQTVNSVETQSSEIQSFKTTDTIEVTESHHGVTKVQFVEPALAPPALAPQPIPSPEAPALPPPTRQLITPPQQLEIPELPPAPVQTASSTSVLSHWQAKEGASPKSQDMIAPPPFEDLNTQTSDATSLNHPVPVQSQTIHAVPSEPFGGDIGADPFVQTACQISPDGYGMNSCQPNCCNSDYCQNGQYCCDLCPNPDPCGIFEPYVSGEVWLGNRRVIAGGGFFIPLWQDCERLLFTDLQGRGDDHSAGDGYFGLGYRKYMDPNVIFGTYLYYDLRSSDQGNVFNQLSIGMELISLDWEFRINGYFPGSSGRSSDRSSGYSNGTVVTRNFEERAYRGLDWEIGHRFLYWGWNDKYEVRWYLGSYHFDHSSSNTLSFGGPRGRLEMRINDLGWLGNQSRLTFGMETSTDRIRHEQIFGFARIQIPFGGAQKEGRDYLDPLRRRMLDAPVRPVK